MDESLRSSLAEIAQQADDLMDEVEVALDEHASFALMLATRVKVDSVTQRYRDSVAKLDEKDRFAADRTTGRKVADLGKMATKLPTAAAGKPASWSTPASSRPARPSRRARRSPLGSRLVKSRAASAPPASPTRSTRGAVAV